MKRIGLLLLLAAMLLTLCACKEDEGVYVPTGDALARDDYEVTTPKDEQTAEQVLELVYSAEGSMHPLLSSDYTNRVLMSLMYQGLFAVDRNYEATPILCSRYSISDDMRTYTFYIENATFSDGTRLNIMDVYTSFQVAKTSDYYGGRFSHVKEIMISGDGGITFQLDTAFENLPILLDIPIVKASELILDEETGKLAVDELTGELLVPIPVGTGPYVLEESLGGLRLRRRTNWWCDSKDLAITASSIKLTRGDDPTAVRDAFEFSSVSLVCADPGSENYADFRGDHELWDCENGSFLYLGCNMTSEVLSNNALRSALTYAIDRNSLVNTYYQGFARTATLPASPQSPYYNSALAARYSYDPQRFAEVVESQRLTGTTVRLLVNQDDTMRLRVAREIAEMLEAGGLKVEMMEYSRSKFLQALSYRNYDIYLGQTRLSPNMDLSPFFRSGGSLRYGSLPDAEIYAMCLESLANAGNYYNLHKMVADDGRLCPVLFHGYAVYAERGLLTGIAPSRDNVFFYSLGKTMEEICTTGFVNG